MAWKTGFRAVELSGGAEKRRLPLRGAEKASGVRVDVDQDHAQLKRDLVDGYRNHFPGGQAPTHDYNEVRDRFVRAAQDARRQHLRLPDDLYPIRGEPR